MGKVSVRYIVSDVDAAIPFYTEMLGFRVDMHPAPGFASLSKGDLHLLLNRPGVGGAAHARRDRISMDVQPTAPLDLTFHLRLLLRGRGSEERSCSRLCSACSKATVRGAECSHVRLTADALVPRRRDVARAAAGAMVAHFHAARVAPPAMRTN